MGEIPQDVVHLQRHLGGGGGGGGGVQHPTSHRLALLTCSNPIAASSSLKGQCQEIFDFKVFS
jgi:hypothetical protein